MSDLPIPAAELLRHWTWVETLARELVRDEAAAQDLVQDTWLAVLRRPPAQRGNLRGYLGTVLRNLWRQHHRAAGRRLGREAAVGGEPPPAASAADVVERAAVQRRVVDAVLDLDEPYRSTVLLRFFDDLPVAAIAAQQDVPVATVRTRLQRAMQRLRERLAARDPRTWALLPALCARPVRHGMPWPLVSLLAMNLRLALAAVLAVTTLWIAIAVQQDDAPPPAAQAGTGAALAAQRADGPERIAAGEPGRRSAVAPVADASEPAPAAAAIPGAPERTVRGTLHDGDGRLLPDRRICFLPNAAQEPPTADRLRTDARGTFAMPFAGGGNVEIDEPGWRTVFTALVPAGAPPRHALVVAAPAVPLGGIVVDAAGAPIAGATVRVTLPGDFRSRFGENADAAEPKEQVATSGADGRFSLEDAGAVRGAELLSAHPSFLPDRRALPLAGDRALRIELRRPDRSDGAVVGMVVDALGAPVPDAWVAIGGRTTRADARGGFAIPAGDGDQLLAARAGLLPARMARPANGWPAHVLVTLGAEPMRIEGRVVDSEGVPQEGVRVWVGDGTSFGSIGRGAALVEGLAAGALTHEDVEARLRQPDAPSPDELLRTQSLAIWPWTRTNADGSFVLSGLFDRAYDLRAMREDLSWTDVRGVAAGARGVEIVLPADASFATVRGRVVSTAGMPIPGVRVVPMCDPIRVDGSTMHAQGAAATTDEDGRFTLRSVPRATAYLRCDGEYVLPLEHGRGVDGGLQAMTGGRVDDLVLTLRLRMHVQVELLDPTSADRLEVLDAEGGRLPIDVFRGRGRRTSDDLPLDAGRTPVFVVPDAAATLRLFAGEREVQRVPLTLLPGRVNRLSF